MTSKLPIRVVVLTGNEKQAKRHSAVQELVDAQTVGDHRKSRFRISESRGPGVRVSLGG